MCMVDITVDFPNDGTDYIGEMNAIKKSLNQYPGYKSIAASLGKYLPQEIVAGLIGCIIPESGTDHTILNKKEYQGNGTNGTYGWNCGEGLVQWTYWKNKEPLIKKYNSNSKSTQKLPETWENYKQGTPIEKGKRLCAASDGQHIAGLSLDNQMLFLTIYYDSLIKKLKGETNLAVIVAKIYQQKAGIGYYADINEPILRAYTTSKNKYPSSSGNHYLQSLKIAQEYYFNGQTPPKSDPPVEETVTVNSDANTSNMYLKDGSTVSPDGTVNNMSGANNKKKKKYVTGIVLGNHMNQK